MAGSKALMAEQVLPSNQQAHLLLTKLIERVGLTKRRFLDHLAELGYPFSDDDFANWGRAGRSFPRSWPALRAMVQVVLQNHTSPRRCSATEALQFLGLTGMPFPELRPLAALFPTEEFHLALSAYLPLPNTGEPVPPTIGIAPSDEPTTLRQIVEPEADGALSSLGTGLQALHALLETGDMRSAVFTFRSDFQAACEQIEQLSSYKQLHDLLQQLEDHYYLLYHEFKRLPADTAAWSSLLRYEPKLEVLKDEIVAVRLGNAPAVEASLWTSKLEHACGALRQGIDANDPALVRSALTRLKDVLGREPSRINTHLVSVAHALRLPALVAALGTLCGRLSILVLDEAAKGKVAVFSQGVDELKWLSGQLTRAISNHNIFQAIDDELRPVEVLLDDNTAEVVYAWQNVKPMTERLCETNAFAWVSKLQSTAYELEQALCTENRLRVIHLFRSYRSQALRGFHQVDHDLLWLCERLRGIGEPLSLVLRMIE